jgi:hypothetical protein
MDLAVSRPSQMTPPPPAELDAMAADIRIWRFVDAYLAANGDIAATAEAIGADAGYVRAMLSSPVVRAACYHEASLALQAARLTRSRLAMRLWKALEDPDLAPEQAVLLADAIRRLLDAAPGSQSGAAAALQVNYEIIHPPQESPHESATAL